MLTILRSHAPYLFAVVAGILLMALEMHLSDLTMMLLICAAVIAHVWLTGRAVRALVYHDRTKTVDSIMHALSKPQD